MIDALPVLFLAAIFALWGWAEHRDAERRRTAPARAARARRELEIDFFARMSDGEQILRLLLLADLREVKAREDARAYLREHYGMEI
jgi:hypothetical protein